MKKHVNSNEPEFSLREQIKQYREIERNQSNIIDILDILDKDYHMDDRTNFSLYFSKQVYEEWRRFCKLHPKLSMADLTDKALIYAMMTIPMKNTLIQIEVPEKSIHDQGLDDRLREIVILPELEDWLKNTEWSIKNKKEIHPRKVDSLRDIVREANKIKVKSEKLRILLEEALNRVE